MRVQPAHNMTFHPERRDDGVGGSERLWGPGTPQRSSLAREQLEVLSDGRTTVGVARVEAVEGG